MKYSILSFILLTIQLTVIGQIDSLTYGLKGKIIRAFEASPTSTKTIYAGLKGAEMGTALVYKSVDTGKTWHPLNNGLPIDPYAADIQAIAESSLPNKTLFAGTWKNGLFKSENGGKSWTKDVHFPSHDIRSIRTGIQNPNLIYAATSNFGVIKSIDGGKHWTRSSPALIDSTFQFAWSIEMDPNNENIIYAQTFNNGIWKSIDQGDTWYQVLDTEGQVAWDANISSKTNEVWVAASQRGGSNSTIYYSSDSGANWNKIKNAPQIGINQINVINKNGKDIMIVGSWEDGVHIENNDGQFTKVESVEFNRIAHILTDKNHILIGSWGNGVYSIMQ